MLYSFNIDVATQLVNSIVNSVRCSICDATSGDRLRHPCGHTICSSCGDTVTSCLNCLTPPGSPAHAVRDEPLSQLAKDTCELLDAFQDAFHVNVALHLKTLEQRKLEKEIFPECIQAPTITYHNRRKSSNTQHCKSRTSIFPGELVDSGYTTMDKSSSYVRDWLEQHNEELLKYQPRTPFADMPINSPNNKNLTNKNTICNKSLKENTIKSNQKRSHYKTEQPQLRLKNFMNTSAKVDNDKSLWKTAKRMKKDVSHTKSKDESGIVVDEDTIVIEDSQQEVQDKDRKAWLAVLEAEKKVASANCITQRCQVTNKERKTRPKERKFDVSPTVLNWLHSDSGSEGAIQPILKKSCKIPFYKKGVVLGSQEKFKRYSVKSKFNKNVSIRIETNDLITTVTVTNSEQTKTAPEKISKIIQTDIQDLNRSKQEDIKSLSLLDDVFISKEKLPVTETKEVLLKDNKTVISESSDSEPEVSSSFVVEALVHRSHDDDVERGILREITGVENLTPRAAKRGLTPASSDSSNKENKDPNRKKPRIDMKKKKKFRH